jgi:hypothetical protein
MRIHTVWGQRVGTENEPELMVAWDEFSVDANPEGFREDVEKALQSWGSDLETHRYIDIRLPDKVINEAFWAPVVEAEVAD